MTNTRAAGTVPAAVIIIGKARPYSSGRIDHRLVAGEVGLARQHVHRLRAGDARHQLHGESGDVGLGGHGLDVGLVAVRVHGRDDQRAGLVGGFRPDGRRTLRTMSAS